MKKIISILGLVILAGCSKTSQSGENFSSVSSQTVVQTGSVDFSSSSIYISDEQIAKNYIGLTLAQAQDLAKKDNKKLVVTKIDGKLQPSNGATSSNNIDIELEKGLVSNVSMETTQISE